MYIRAVDLTNSFVDIFNAVNVPARAQTCSLPMQDDVM